MMSKEFMKMIYRAFTKLTYVINEPDSEDTRSHLMDAISSLSQALMMMDGIPEGLEGLRK